MSTTPKITMIGMYNHDEKLFDEMTLPPGINKEDFINTFLLNYGEFPVMYPSWQILKFAIGVWSKKWYHSIERIIRAMTEEYDPLHNFDRHEVYTDTEDKKGTNSTNRKLNETVNENADRTTDTYNDSNTNEETERTVSAYNEDSYQPDNKETGTANTTANGNIEEESSRKETRNGTDDLTGETSEDRNLKHEGHLYGNIGVTKSTDMLADEISIRRQQNILDIVSEMLFKEVCIYTY